jgi:hypothetical protein
MNEMELNLKFFYFLFLEEVKKRLGLLQTVANKEIQPTKWCIYIDINLCLNRESVTYFAQKPMTRLI